ncbi:MAG: glycosyltransferase family 2 protein [Verrucomicrobia bacterium]|nr:glycosyltransferase family 2 protein [Verrucomicrobiota bacterium]
MNAIPTASRIERFDPARDGLAEPSTLGDETPPMLSVVVPFYNEQDNVLPMLERLVAELEKLGEPYEIIAIDDGSTDSTFGKLRECFACYERLRVVSFRRNFGQTAALSAGINLARGKVIVTIDGDLQNDPADIHRLLDKINEGYDIVSGWRKERKERFLDRRLPSRVANALISRISRVRLHDYGCTLKAYVRDVVKNLSLYGDMHRFIPAMASQMGARVTEIAVSDNPRRAGKSKYGLTRTYKVVLDLLTLKFMLTFFHRPMLLFGVAGSLASLVGLGLGIYTLIYRYILLQPVSDRPLLMLGPPFLFITGLIFISFGLQFEMMMRMYHESQKKPTYVVRAKLDRTDPDNENA